MVIADEHIEIDTTREKMERIWHFSSIFPRDSSPCSNVWKRYNPWIIWLPDNAKNFYILSSKYSGSHEKMMLAYCRSIITKIENGKKEEEYIVVKGLNYNFFLMDWAFENSALLGHMTLPSTLGTISNLSKIVKQAMQPELLRQEIYDVYSKIVFPALEASGGSLWFNVEEETENYLEIREVKTFRLRGIDIVIESMKYLRHKLEEIC